MKQVYGREVRMFGGREAQEWAVYPLAAGLGLLYAAWNAGRVGDWLGLWALPLGLGLALALLLVRAGTGLRLEDDGQISAARIVWVAGFTLHGQWQRFDDPRAHLKLVPGLRGYFVLTVRSGERTARSDNALIALEEGRVLFRHIPEFTVDLDAAMNLDTLDSRLLPDQVKILPNPDSAAPVT